MAQWVKAKRMSVFSSTPYAGNPAWVILSSKGMLDETMRQIANDLNPLSDTAFVQPEPTKEADIFLRFFTGSGEVSFSGHAAIATYFALSGEQFLALKEPITVIRQRTKAGIQQVELRIKGDKITRATILLSKPNYMEQEINPVAVAKCLGLTSNDITQTCLPFDIISSGFYDLIVPIKSIADMQKIAPNFSLMDSFCTRLGIHGIIAFCPESFDPGDDAFMRHFAPCLGVNEDPISGASAGSLGCYMVRHRMVEPSNFTRVKYLSISSVRAIKY
jgi:trans-2,3-dihydro-3-hydroxyanthranilate isomerase